VKRRLNRLVLACGVTASLLLVGCASSSQLSGSSGSGSSSGGSAGSGDSLDKLLADAPVADSIPSGTLMAKIKQAGVLKVGGTDSGPVFSIKDPVTGKLTGFDADLSQMLAKYIIGQPKTSLTLTSVATREPLLQNGTVDAVFATYTITPARAQKVDFAGPYYMSGDAILVKKTNTSVTKISDLNGKTVATESNSTAATSIAKFAPKAKILLFADDNSCVQAVQQGRADAYVLDQGILLGDATKATDVKVVGTPFTQEPYGIGTPKQNPEMKKFVNDWLKKIEDAGLWKRLYALTIGKVVSGEPPSPPAIGSVPGS
jgi:glutamate transport system substrate-binding protein